jgi:hypothetical protein
MTRAFRRFFGWWIGDDGSDLLKLGVFVVIGNLIIGIVVLILWAAGVVFDSPPCDYEDRAGICHRAP